jgi:hypothetical protein
VAFIHDNWRVTGNAYVEGITAAIAVPAQCERVRLREFPRLFVELGAVEAHAVEDIGHDARRIVLAVTQLEALGLANVELNAEQRMVLVVLTLGDLGKRRQVMNRRLVLHHAQHQLVVKGV